MPKKKNKKTSLDNIFHQNIEKIKKYLHKLTWYDYLKILVVIVTLV